MADPRFFNRVGPFRLDQLAEIAGAGLGEGADPGRIFHDVSTLEDATADQISFLDNRKYAEAFQASKAGAAVIHPDMVGRAPEGMSLLLSKDPYRAYAKIAQAFYPPTPVQAWIAPTAYVDEAASLGDGVRIEWGAVIEAEAQIGARCVIGPNVVIGRGVVLGDDCVIGANATVQFALLGSRVTIYPGARIGQDGFGFAMGPQGHLRVPQLGRVIIGDDVEVGANATIDRGAGPDTVIGSGSMIDNLVQIGHNVQLGRGCVIVAQVGISGSTKLGDFVVAAGQVGISGHLKIGSGARIAAQSGVIKDIGPGETWGGYPAVRHTEWLRQAVLLKQLAKK